LDKTVGAICLDGGGPLAIAGTETSRDQRQDVGSDLSTDEKKAFADVLVLGNLFPDQASQLLGESEDVRASHGRGRSGPHRQGNADVLNKKGFGQIACRKDFFGFYGLKDT